MISTKKRFPGFNKIKNTKRLLRFFLYNPSEGQIELYHGPDGWDKAGYSFARSKRYSGIFRKYALSKLGFPKEGKAFLEKVNKEQGFEAEIIMIVWAWDSTKLTYYEDFRGNIQLVDKDVDDLLFTVPVSDSSFEDKVINREDVKVIMTKKSANEVYKDLDGGVVQGYANEVIPITLSERIDFLNNTLTSDREEFYSSENDPVIPVLLLGVNQDEGGVKGNTNDFKSESGSFYKNSTGGDANVEIQGSVDFGVVINPLILGESDIVVNLYIINSSNVIVKTINVPVSATFLGSVFLGDSYTASGIININEEIENSNYIQFGLMNDGWQGLTGSGVILDFTVNTQGDFTPSLNIETQLTHEAGARILQKTTGALSPLYSEALGRKDSEPRSYTYNGLASGLAFTNGALIRGFKQTNNATYPDIIAPLAISFKDWFDSQNVIRPLGMGIEVINGIKTVRVEPLTYFFDTRIAITINNASEVKEDYNKDLIMNSAQVGYQKFESDTDIDGVYDYNTKVEYSNAITSVKNQDKQVSPISASNTSINTARKITKAEKPTTDSKYDGITYMIDIIENEAGNAVSNGDAEQDLFNWSITGGVTVETLVGSKRFVLQSRTTGGAQVSLSQDLVAIPTPVLSFSYAIISSDKLIITPTVHVIAKLNTGELKALDSNGDWRDNSIESFPIDSVQGVLETEFQSMSKFEIAANFLDDVQEIIVEFETDFLTGKSGTNEYIIDDIFLSDSAKYKARTTEGFEFIRGIVNANDSYNIDLSPAQCFLRHGAIYRAPLEDKLNTDYVFSDSDKFSTLVSKKIDQNFEVAESINFLVNDLEKPFYDIERRNIEALLTSEQKRELNGSFDDGKPKSQALVAWRENTNQAFNYAWINEYNSGGSFGVSKFELRPISKYVQVAEEAIAVDDDLENFTDNNNENFIIE